MDCTSMDKDRTDPLSPPFSDKYLQPRTLAEELIYFCRLQVAIAAVGVLAYQVLDLILDLAFRV